MFGRAFPAARHLAIGVDGTEGEPGDRRTLEELGVEVEINAVLTAAELREPGLAKAGTVLRPLHDDDDWKQAVGLRLAVYDESADAEHEAFVERQVTQSRKICDGGHGRWFGAFVDGRLVSALGLIRALPDTGRYQTVETLASYRRQGLAKRLLFEASRWGIESLGLRRLVICADPAYHAVTLYTSLGFTVSERQVQLQRAPVDG